MRTLSLLLFSAMIVSSAFPQEKSTFHPLAVEGKQWNFKRLVTPDDEGDKTLKHHYTYKVHGDTVIQGIDYKKLYMNDFTYPISSLWTAEDFYASPTVGKNGFLDNDWHYVAALRDEDSRAYLIHADTNEELLLYDVSLEPGVYENLGMKIISKYDYSEQGVRLRVLRWLYHGSGPVPTYNDYATYWIEAVGYMVDEFHLSGYFRQIWNITSQLESVFEKDVCIYGDPTVITSVRDLPSEPVAKDSDSKYYDLSGRRLSAPPAKGVYIQDGRVKIKE